MALLNVFLVSVRLLGTAGGAAGVAFQPGPCLGRFRGEGVAFFSHFLVVHVSVLSLVRLCCLSVGVTAH